MENIPQYMISHRIDLFGKNDDHDERFYDIDRWSNSVSWDGRKFVCEGAVLAVWAKLVTSIEDQW